jgi:hypothetical protein
VWLEGLPGVLGRLAGPLCAASSASGKCGAPLRIRLNPWTAKSLDVSCRSWMCNLVPFQRNSPTSKPHMPRSSKHRSKSSMDRKGCTPKTYNSQPLGCRTTVQSGSCKSALHVCHRLSLFELEQAGGTPLRQVQLQESKRRDALQI